MPKKALFHSSFSSSLFRSPRKKNGAGSSGLSLADWYSLVGDFVASFDDDPVGFDDDTDDPAEYKNEGNERREVKARPISHNNDKQSTATVTETGMLEIVIIMGLYAVEQSRKASKVVVVADPKEEKVRSEA